MATNNNSKNLMLEHVIRDRIDVEKLGLMLVGKEYTTALGRIDILTTDETGGYVPIEIKLGEATDSAIGQIMGYMKAVDAVRGIIIAECFSDRVQAISTDINVELMPYHLEVVVCDQLMTYTNDAPAERNTIKLTANELKIVDFLAVHGPADVSTIAKTVGLSYHRVRRLLVGAKNGNGGMLGKVQGLEVTDMSREAGGGYCRVKEYALVGFDLLSSYSNIVSLPADVCDDDYVNDRVL